MLENFVVETNASNNTLRQIALQYVNIELQAISTDSSTGSLDQALRSLGSANISGVRPVARQLVRDFFRREVVRTRAKNADRQNYHQHARG